MIYWLHLDLVFPRGFKVPPCPPILSSQLCGLRMVRLRDYDGPRVSVVELAFEPLSPRCLSKILHCIWMLIHTSVFLWILGNWMARCSLLSDHLWSTNRQSVTDINELHIIRLLNTWHFWHYWHYWHFIIWISASFKHTHTRPTVRIRISICQTSLSPLQNTKGKRFKSPGIRCGMAVFLKRNLQMPALTAFFSQAQDCSSENKKLPCRK